MAKTIARQALYDAVWAQPVTRLSKHFGVSDVGLAKACRKLSVPIPPRGYRARKAAGKPVIQAALPPRPPGLGDETTIGGGGGTGWGWSGPPDEIFLGDVPPTPIFDEPIELVRARIEAAIGEAAVVRRELGELHPLVAKLLREDGERRAKSSGQSYVAPWERVLYDTPIQRRRQRLVSGILTTAARCGCRGDLGLRPEAGHPQGEFSLLVGDQRAGSRVAADVDEPLKRGKAAGPRAASTIRVSFKGRVWENVHAGDAAAIRGIAVALVLGGEEAHRERSLSVHVRWMERRAAALERRRKETEEAARRERERVAELERKRVERLLGEAEALRKARAVRAYVEEVRATAAAAPKASWMPGRNGPGAGLQDRPHTQRVVSARNGRQLGAAEVLGCRTIHGGSTGIWTPLTRGR